MPERDRGRDPEPCRRLLGALSEYIDGELAEELCREIEAHLATCRNCRVVVDTLRKTILLYQMAAPPELPAEVEERLFRALDLTPYLRMASPVSDPGARRGDRVGDAD